MTDAPCAACGVTAKTLHVTANDSAVITESVSLGLELARDRSWCERWTSLLENREYLAAIYAVTAPGDVADWVAVANACAQDAHELRDAIRGDNAVPAATKSGIEKDVPKSTRAINMLADVNNTRKHGGRRPDLCHARVAGVTWGDGEGPRLSLERQCPGGSAGRRDALEVVDEAVQEWRQVLDRHGLATDGA